MAEPVAIEAALADLDAKIERALDLAIELGDLGAAKEKLRGLRAERERVAGELSRARTKLPTTAELLPRLREKLREIGAPHATLLRMRGVSKIVALLIAAGVVVALLLAPAPATAESVLIEAGRDTTLIEEPDGALANGSGPVFFVGRTNQVENSVRRGLIYFDVAAALPGNARVESVRLTLYMSPSNSASRQIGLHRLLAAWGEGSSFASGGGGDFAAPGDATWIHTFFDDGFWVKPGAHFVPRASASRDVAASGFYTWEGTRKMVADVRLWLAAPHRNFGWILRGDETTPQNVKGFASREEPDPSLRPVLEVTYHLPGEEEHPGPVAPLRRRSMVRPGGRSTAGLE